MRGLRRLFSRSGLDEPLIGIEQTKDGSYRLPVDRDPADALRIELRLASDQLIESRRHDIRRATRIKRGGIVVATALSTLVVTTTGANALGLEIPVLHATLDTLITQSAADETTQPPAYGQPVTLADVRRQPQNASELLTSPLGAGPRRIVGAAYMGATGRLCFAWTVRGSASSKERLRTGACQLLNHVFAGIMAAEGALGTIEVDETAVVLVGYTSDEVEAVTVHGPGGQLQVALSAGWTPDFLDIPRFRVFLAVRELQTRRALNPKQERRVLNVSNYEIKARFGDGHARDIPL